MSANTIERRDAGETARRLAETASRGASTSQSNSEQKCIDPRNQRAVAEHAMEQWIESASNSSSYPSTATTHSGMPYARLSPNRAVQGAHGGGHGPEAAPAQVEPAPVTGKDGEVLLGVGFHAAGLAAAAYVHPAVGLGVIAAYWATHAMSHDKEGAEAIMHGATMLHPH